MSAAHEGNLVELQWLLRPDLPAERLLPARVAVQQMSNI
jgi:hypothetical protein